MLLTLVLLIIYFLLTLLACKLFISSRRLLIYKNRPSRFSMIAGLLLIGNWILYIISVLKELPIKMTDGFFLPLWICLTIFGYIISYMEYRNNRNFSIIIGYISSISSLYVFFQFLSSKI